ncbi:hypothetical protein BJ322DRAFT_430352 [Thelephora terrestris]|uniref:Uncharacterized protein n=1 Tax=Thelephora terrestris TaxID=56493 RepID=A0A9P6LBR7_9AGAM|nr:hypothetical protein BJ322DRAFT_430352 [Thelephora terrestris]
MHRRRGGKIFSFSRHIQARTTATATKQAVSTRQSAWDIPNNRPTVPPSLLTTPTSVGLGKWAPPFSKWAKPELEKPSTKAESKIQPISHRRDLQAIPSHNQGPRHKPSVSFRQPRGAPATGKWSKPSRFTPHNVTPSTSAKPVADEPIVGPSRVLQVDERSSGAELREEQVGESHRSLIKPWEDQHPPRQNRRWEANERYKPRGSLRSRQGHDIIPHQPRIQDMRITPKPKVRKAKKSLRVNPDINVPSTVSVGNFARLLNVSLGEDFGLSGCGI